MLIPRGKTQPSSTLKARTATYCTVAVLAKHEYHHGDRPLLVDFAVQAGQENQKDWDQHIRQHETKAEWSSPTKQSPSRQYHLHTVGTQNCLCTVERRGIRVVVKYAEEPDPLGSLEFLQAAQSIMDEHPVGHAQHCRRSTWLVYSSYNNRG